MSKIELTGEVEAVDAYDAKYCLEKAIQKAIDGGWVLWGKVDNYYVCGKCKQEAAFTDFNGKYHEEDGGKWHHKTRKPNLFEYEGKWLLGWTDDKMDFQTLDLSINDFIFNHDFAKALFGDDEYKYCKVCNRHHYDETDQNNNIRPDHYHLQLMVIAENPLKYLGDTLTTK